jgi:hypothetical protein
MKEETRRAVAFVAAARINRQSRHSIYSFAEGCHTPMSGNAQRAYDYGVGAHIVGSGSSLYHYGNGAHIKLNINEPQFSGYDYDSGNHFSGRVIGNRVTLYDHGEAGYFHYRV